MGPGDCLAAVLHFVDSTPPCFGRSFGTTRGDERIRHVEWTTAEYRRLLDDEDWLKNNGPFHWAIMARLLGNGSNFLIEPFSEKDQTGVTPDPRCQPHLCVSPRYGREGVARLQVRTLRRAVRGGTVMPQFSLKEYFEAMQAVLTGEFNAVWNNVWLLPVRRFNPASLTTVTGRSVIAQLTKVAGAIVIEDPDLRPEHLLAHREQFGLHGTAAVHCRNDGFHTEAQHYVVTKPAWAERLRGDRLW
jgi:hypothetical protein